MNNFFTIATWELYGEYRIPPKTFEDKVLKQCNIAGRKTIWSLLITPIIHRRLYRAGIYFLDQLEQQTVTDLQSLWIVLWTIREIESILMVRNREFTGFVRENGIK